MCPLRKQDWHDQGAIGAVPQWDLGPYQYQVHRVRQWGWTAPKGHAKEPLGRGFRIGYDSRSGSLIGDHHPQDRVPGMGRSLTQEEQWQESALSAFPSSVDSAVRLGPSSANWTTMTEKPHGSWLQMRASDVAWHPVLPNRLGSVSPSCRVLGPRVGSVVELLLPVCPTTTSVSIHSKM